MPTQYTPEQFVAVFWSRVDRNGPLPAHCPDLGPCWVWLAQRSRQGYGRIRYQGRMRGAHVVAYILTTGHEPPPAAPCVTHLCDGGATGCVRPSHLMADTQAGNQRQKIERGRQAKGDRSGYRLHPERYPRGDRHPWRLHPDLWVRRGERNTAAKLTDGAVREIRRRYLSGNVSQQALSVEYGVNPSTISLIVNRRRWLHL